jgi:glycosyltransferase involved in cell wall biosynthesis
MRVLEVSHLYPVPRDRLLGAAIHNQIRHASKKGCEVQVIAPTPWIPLPLGSFSTTYRLYTEVPVHEVIEGIEVFHPRYITFPRALFFSSSGRRMYYGIRDLVKKIHEEFPFDLIHAHTALPDGYAGMLLSQDYNKPLAVTFQATDVDITAKRGAKCLRALRAVFNAADRVIAPSPRLYRQLLRDFGIEPMTIGYGVDPSEIYSGPRQSELRSFRQGRRILLSVSRLIPTKGLDLNLFALKRLVDRHLDLLYLVVGEGPARQSLQRLVCDLELEKHVEFIGQLPHQQVMEYMSSCDIFTLPSWQETFGLVYIEAMAHAKPVVACRGQGVDGIIVHGENGLLAEPKDVDSLVQALDFLLTYTDKARAIGEQARSLVLENFTWKKSGDRCTEVYEEVLGSTRE